MIKRTLSLLAPLFLVAAAVGGETGDFPRYGAPQYLLTITRTAPQTFEPFVTCVDVNGDGLDDVVIAEMSFQTWKTYPLRILLNNGRGGLVLAAGESFVGGVPSVQNPRQVITEDFNGDGVPDVFVADHGYDAPPFPGFQNALLLSALDGKVVDGTSGLPQRPDYTHSACAGDVDGDGDIDLYVGNVGGLYGVNPQILLNDGTGTFSPGAGRLPTLTSLSQSRYTTCELADVTGDGAIDLVLGDAGGDGSDPYTPRCGQLLVNDGRGFFTWRPNALPRKPYSSHDIAHDIQPIDLNGDPYTDLLIVLERQPSLGSYILALVNTGNGTFRDETSDRLDPLVRRTWIPWLELRDMDADGDQDLLARPWDDGDPDPILFANDGEGRFTEQHLEFGLPYLYYVFLDLDGDGGLDLVFITFAPPEEVYVIRQLD